MRRHYSFVAVLALSSVLACKQDQEQLPESPIVSAVHDETVDFSKFETFDIVEPQDVPEDQTLPEALLEVNRIAVMDSIVKELEARGYTRDQESPDLEITTFVRYRDVEVVTEEAYWQNYYYGWYWGYGYPWYDRDIIELEAGSLVIDAVDVGDRDDQSDDTLVFRGTATALMPDEPTDISAEIPAVIAEIFEHWPRA